MAIRDEKMNSGLTVDVVVVVVVRVVSFLDGDNA